MARQFATLVIALALTLSATADESLRAFDAQYGGRFSGAKIEIDIARRVVGNDITVYKHSEPRGLARLIRRDGVIECGRYTLADSRPKPSVYSYVDGKPGRGKSTTVTFSADGRSAASSYRDAAVTLDVSAGAVDKISEEFVAAARLAAGETEFTLRVIERNEIHNVAYRVTATETIAVAVGEYETLVVDRRRGNSSRTTRVWLAPELAYQPVRLQRLKDGKVQGTASLKRFSWVDQARGSVTPVCP
ncbi:MAG: DUF3108 domain-containing protein [Pseudomonadota bacterium]